MWCLWNFGYGSHALQKSHQVSEKAALFAVMFWSWLLRRALPRLAKRLVLVGDGQAA